MNRRSRNPSDSSIPSIIVTSPTPAPRDDMVNTQSSARSSTYASSRSGPSSDTRVAASSLRIPSNSNTSGVTPRSAQSSSRSSKTYVSENLRPDVETSTVIRRTAPPTIPFTAYHPSPMPVADMLRGEIRNVIEADIVSYIIAAGILTYIVCAIIVMHNLEDSGRDIGLALGLGIPANHSNFVHYGRRPLDRALQHRPTRHHDQEDMYSPIGALGKCSCGFGVVYYVRWSTYATVDWARFRTSSLPLQGRKVLTGQVW
ncbi:hypothetical protein HBH98_069760 [Parastagonospora nodorum]|nr:hypothetical protein HBH51_131250 [Parastagonospora nodorum]KAH4051112.1 hypothetical protein HBH49_113360 [Parastagonospora nodorum]KAH4073887.1 hypothetical protein HBH50_039700 [Parastagonospora nodorum]KAH4091119.1 hypothetical protein HBH46_187180 [Parastagonospora nodorum]KAH4091400.1 hypothetical protein HBH48_092020 [Parastagonospora nodorum]